MVVGDQQKYLSCLLTLRVIQDEVTSLPTNQLDPMAVEACQRVGSSAQTVSDIVDRGDHKVLKMIQKGIDHTNRKASAKVQKVSPKPHPPTPAGPGMCKGLLVYV